MKLIYTFLKNLNLTGFYYTRRPNNIWVILISGMQWGDEGKGKLVSHLSENFELIARYNGGHNSGHEVLVNGVQFKLHLLPCGSLNPNTVNVLGNGVVVHLESLVKEMDLLLQFGIDLTNRLFISDRAHLIFDFHIASDVKSEVGTDKYSKPLGTTKRGIGPTYSTKCLRTGIMIGEMLNWENFEKLVTNFAFNLRSSNLNLTDEEAETLSKKELEKHKKLFNRVSHCITDTSQLIRKFIKEGKGVFFEGANGVLLDLNLGTYPYVTSSNTTTSGVYNGLGVSPSVNILKIGVLKAYQTRVGEGPFLTELFDENFDKLSNLGGEFGVTTGRPRRCGWLDLVAAKYVQASNGFDLINLTKLDILSNFDEIKVCVNYKHKKTGELLEDGSFPSCIYKFDEYEPVYKTFEGWKTDISNSKSFDSLPEKAKEYVLFLEDQLGVHIQWIGTGKDVNSMIVRNKK